MKKIKRIIASMLAFTLLFVVVACNGTKDPDTTTTKLPDTSNETPKESGGQEPVAGQGKVLNIWGWNDEF